MVTLILCDLDLTASGGGGKGPQTVYKMLASKAHQFNKCIVKADGHLKRLGSENDRER